MSRSLFVFLVYFMTLFSLKSAYTISSAEMVPSSSGHLEGNQQVKQKNEVSSGISEHELSDSIPEAEVYSEDDSDDATEFEDDSMNDDDNAIPSPCVAKKCSCGMSRNTPSRNSGGEKAEKNEFPWMAAIYLENSVKNESEKYLFTCGGVIISPRHILTTKFCTNFVRKKGIKSLKVAVGSNDRRKLAFKEVYKVTYMLAYRKAKNFDFDISLIVLKKKLNLAKLRVGKICMPPHSFNPTSGDAIFTGWGQSKHNGTIQRFLKKTKLELGTKYCENQTLDEKWANKNSAVCAGGNGNNSICYGDSGGPLSYIQNDRHYLIGIHHSGTVRGCNVKGSPEIFLRITHPRILKWILFHTKEQTCSRNV